MKRFVGREDELNDLKLLLKKNSASLVVIRGRRRIGKSRLIEEFCSSLPTVSLVGIPPTKHTTQASQREEFARQLQYTLKIKKPESDDWNLLFQTLVNQTKNSRIVVVMDEISWIGHKDPDFLGKLKNAWDLGFKQNPNLILILCGSVASWIEDNILKSTGFVGRITLNMHLKELPIRDCARFWDGKGCKYDPYEIFKALAVTGGIPRYLEEIMPSDSAESNIQRLCFKSTGLLFNEFDSIFHDLFAERTSAYKKILLEMCDRSLFLKDVYSALGVEPSGSYSDYVDDLEQAGFIKRDYTWDLKTGKDSLLSRFRICDNYARFYLRCILPNQSIIKDGSYDSHSVAHRKHWNTTLSLQFETLVINNVQCLYPLLNLARGEVLRAGPFFQRKSTRYKGCQIDLLIQTHHRVLYLVEIKFSQNCIGTTVQREVQEKMNRIHLPRGFSVKPVLVHVNGVADSLYTDRFFSHIIDFSDLLA